MTLRQALKRLRSPSHSLALSLLMGMPACGGEDPAPGDQDVPSGGSGGHHAGGTGDTGGSGAGASTGGTETTGGTSSGGEGGNGGGDTGGTSSGGGGGNGGGDTGGTGGELGGVGGGGDTGGMGGADGTGGDGDTGGTGGNGDTGGTGGSDPGHDLGWLLYRTIEQDVSRVFAVDLTEESAEPLSLLDNGWVEKPLWSPDGLRAAFVAREEEEAPRALYVIDFSTDVPGPAEQIASSVTTSFFWSPDSSAIAYVSEDAELWLADALADHEPVLLAAECPVDDVNLACGISEEEGDVQWSPDGQWVAFRATPRDPAQYTSELFIVPTTESAPPHLVSPLEHGTGNTGVVRYVWSPDSRKIAVVGNIDVQYRQDAYVVELSGTTFGNWTPLTAGTPDIQRELPLPLWLAGSNAVVLSGRLRSNTFEELFLVAVDDGPSAGELVDLSRLPAGTTLFSPQMHPRLSPSGSHLAYTLAGVIGGNLVQVLYVVALDPVLAGAAAAPVQVDMPVSTVGTSFFTWAPGLDRLLAAGSLRLFLAEAPDFSETTELDLNGRTLSTSNATAFSWAPDASGAAYISGTAAERDLFYLSLLPDAEPGAPELVSFVDDDGTSVRIDGSVRLGSMLWSTDSSLLGFEIDTAVPTGPFELFVAPLGDEAVAEPFRAHSPLIAGSSLLEPSFRP